jgi:SAM-dependent methyltransferase
VSATDRLRSEQAFHDRQARDRAATFALRPDALCFADDTYLDHETWIRPAFNRLGDVSGQRVLDLGCGHGMAAIVLARRGACVTALDLSPGYLDEARTRARANHTAVAFLRADGERLPFADAAFDAVWANAVLHHLDLRLAGPELHRVLRPGGLAVCCEPWAENPFLSWARRRLRYAGKARTADERPLGRRDLLLLRQIFPRLEVQGFQLVSMARRVVGDGRLVTGLNWCDDLLLRRVPALQRFCRYAVLALRR